VKCLSQHKVRSLAFQVEVLVPIRYFVSKLEMVKGDYMVSEIEAKFCTF